jgi:hypothetical protein
MTFYQCYELISVTIGRSVISIEEHAFSECAKLASVIIPDSVASIGLAAFANCENLISVTFEGKIDSNKFSDNAFPGGLRNVFYADNPNGTPGTYTRMLFNESDVYDDYYDESYESETWTRQW